MLVLTLLLGGTLIVLIIGLFSGQLPRLIVAIGLCLLAASFLTLVVYLGLQATHFR